jgi:hypothetical protein
MLVRFFNTWMRVRGEILTHAKTHRLTEVDDRNTVKHKLSVSANTRIQDIAIAEYNSLREL